ncbi:S-formylglutathione hydrolase [soil metagenome]
MAAQNLELLSSHCCFGGKQSFYRHDSTEIGLPMRFSVYLPPQALDGQSCASVIFLAGLTCTEETFMTKAGAQQVAAREGLILIAPDTSPRSANIPGDSESWDFGVGAGFYLDATEQPWAKHYRMESYLVGELRTLLADTLKIDPALLGIMGHSMGGHGALVLALRNPGIFRSVSALAPIAAPTQCSWGRKAFAGYLGNDEEKWHRHDATALMNDLAAPPYPEGILIDQGLDDKFLTEQLHPEFFEAACKRIGQALTLRRHAGYDHGYYFISTFIEDHLMHHRTRL